MVRLYARERKHSRRKEHLTEGQAHASRGIAWILRALSRLYEAVSLATMHVSVDRQEETGVWAVTEPTTLVYRETSGNPGCVPRDSGRKDGAHHSAESHRAAPMFCGSHRHCHPLWRSRGSREKLCDGLLALRQVLRVGLCTPRCDDPCLGEAPSFPGRHARSSPWACVRPCGARAPFTPHTSPLHVGLILLPYAGACA